MARRKDIGANIKAGYSKTKHGPLSSFKNPYMKRADVESNVSAFESLLAAYGDESSVEINILIQQLQNLYKSLQAQENKLFTVLRVNGVAELQAKIDKWNKSGAKSILEDGRILEIQNLFYSQINQADLIKDLNDILLNDTIIQTAIVQTGQIALDDVAKALTLSTADASGTPKMKFTSSNKIGVNISLKFELENGKVKVTEKGPDLPLKDAMKRKIGEYINEKTSDKQYEISKKAYVDIAPKIVEILTRDVSGDALVRSCIEREVIENGKKYDHYANYNSIKGWLGELYWNAAFHYFFPTLNVIPTGTFRNAKNQEVSVDIIVREFGSHEGIGFQVKHWNLKEVSGEKTHETNRNMLFGNFLTTRAESLSDEVRSIIARMFGSAAYNLPNPAYANSYYDEYKAFYESHFDWISTSQASANKKNKDVSGDKGLVQTVSTGSYTVSRLERIFQGCISKIIGIDRIDALMKVGDEGWLKGQTFMNTLWLVNDRILQSSVIIQSLIESIQSGWSKNSYVTFQFAATAFERSGQGKSIWPDDAANFDDLHMANRWKINYNVIFNITQILKKMDSIAQQKAGV